MATVTTNVIQITLSDEGGYSKSISLDDPKENITLNEINTAIQPALSGRWWIGNKGDVITALKSAQYTQTIKTQIAGEDVSITPAQIENSNYTGSTYNTTVTVTGASIQVANFTSLSAQKQSDSSTISVNKTISFTDDSISIQISPSTTDSSGIKVDGNIAIVIQNQIFNVPIKLYKA